MSENMEINGSPKSDAIAVTVNKRQLVIGAVVVLLLLIAVMSRSGGSTSSASTTTAQLTPAQQVSNFVAVGLTKLNAGDIDAARDSFKSALAIDPSHVVANYDMGVVLQQYDKKPAEAIPYYSKVLALDPNYNNALYNRALSYRSIGDASNAIADFTALIDKLPDDANSMKQLGDLLIKEGKTAEGNAMLERAYAINPDLKNN